MRPETTVVHGGGSNEFRAVAPSIHPSTTFERAPDGSHPYGLHYSRDENPTRAAVEQLLASLEGGIGSVAFSSGMAAANAIFATLGSGDHALIPAECYYAVGALGREVFSRWGVDVTAVDMTDLPAVERAMRPSTRLLWIETPSNPTLSVVDIAALADLARRNGAVSAVDNTMATPLLQRPFDHHADVVMHSTTKFLGGHSDLLGGAVVVRDDSALLAEIRRLRTVTGAVPSAFDCWLLQRGIATLGLRIAAASRTAMMLAQELAMHPQVSAVYYPGLPAHPRHAIARRQMRDFGGVLSFEVAGGAERARQVAARMRLFTQATSFGGVHSLVEHRASIEPPGGTTPPGLLRLSIGVEHGEDLRDDVLAALGGTIAEQGERRPCSN